MKLTDNSDIQTEFQIRVELIRGSSFIGQVPLNGYLAAKSVKFQYFYYSEDSYL
jgi:hypothetical protein